MTSHRLARAARGLADQQTQKIAQVPASRLFFATVHSVTAGAASDGNALVELSWRGSVGVAAGYPDSYTPVVGHRVACALLDGQPVILGRIIGQP